MKTKNKWRKFNSFFLQVEELIKGSRIYVNVFDLKTALTVAKSNSELARDLLPLVFTEDALSKCSLGGALASNGATRRPGLNKRGVNGIISE